MACCCTKISKCKSDITKVTNAKNALQVLKNNNVVLDGRLIELSARMQEMATPDNMGSCVDSIKNMNKDSAPGINAMINQCTNKISSLQSDQTRYEKEDKEHHDKLKK